METISRK